MTKYWSLTKALLLQQFRGKSVAKKEKVNGKKRSGIGGKIGLGILIAVGLLPLVIMIVGGAWFAGTLYQNVESKYIVTLLMLIVQSFVLLFGLPAIINGIFAPTDGEKILYLPVATTTVFASKLTIAYFNELITAVVGTLVLLLPFGIGASMGAGYYILLLPVMLVMPILPLVIGCILALPLSALTRKLAKNTTIRTIISILLFVAIMAVYMYGVFAITDGLEVLGLTLDDMTDAEASQYLLQLVTDFNNSIKGAVVYLYPTYLLGSALTSATLGGLLLNTIGGIGINAVLLAIAVLLSIMSYSKNMSTMLEGKGNKKKRNQKAYVYQSRAIMPTLIITNLKRFFKDPKLSMQLILSLVMPALIVVIFGVSFGMGADSDMSFVAENQLFQMIIALVLLGYLTLLCSGSNVLAVYPYSLERSSMYMLKILPVKVETIMMSKVLMATMLISVESILCAIVAVITLQLSWYHALFMCIALAVYQFGTMCITSYLDLKKPNLQWSDYNASLKNGKNAMISLLCGLIVMVLIGGVGALFVLWYLSTEAVMVQLLMWLAIIIVGCVFALFAYKHVTFHGKKAFDNLEL